MGPEQEYLGGYVSRGSNSPKLAKKLVQLYPYDIEVTKKVDITALKAPLSPKNDFFISKNLNCEN